MKKNFSIKRAAIILTISLALTAPLTYWIFGNNIHTVMPGEVYRSAQLKGQSLEWVLQNKGIQSVVNLRGENEGRDWYDEQVQVIERNNATLYNIPIPAHAVPRPDSMQTLAEILENAPRPVLIHCRAGADRTGLASQMMLLLEDEDLEVAKRQVSALYLAISPSTVGRLVTPKYEQWLQEQGLESNRENFLQWVSQLAA